MAVRVSAAFRIGPAIGRSRRSRRAQIMLNRRLKSKRSPRPRGLLTLRLNGEDPPPRSRLLSPRAEVTVTDIHLPRLPDSFEGLKIVHLTDIHHSRFTRIEEVEHAVRLANRQRPDLVLLTGDYVSFSPQYIAPVAQALGKLRSRMGIYAVLGNHDFLVDPDGVTAALEEQGIATLRNRSRAIRKGTDRIWLVGVDDLQTQDVRPDGALRHVPGHEPKILLCHNPVGIFWAAARQIDLVLSGHTHGGQIRLPGVRRALARPKLGRRFLAGWNRLNGTQIYVSRGIGMVLLPIRVACPPEVTVLRLRKA